jgi:hypothetical protein
MKQPKQIRRGRPPANGHQPRKVTVATRLTDDEAKAFDRKRLPGENRSNAARRLLV